MGRGSKTRGCKTDQQRQYADFEDGESDLRIAAELDSLRDDGADHHHPPRRGKGNSGLIVRQTRLQQL